MPTIKEYKAKLQSLHNIEKITRTMKLVAASKLRMVHQAQANAKAYAAALTALIARLAASVSSASHPLLQPKDKVSNVLVVVFTSDKGLCGGFNNNLNKTVFSWINENKSNFAGIKLSFCGKRGQMYFKNRGSLHKNYEQVTSKPAMAKAIMIGNDLSKSFLSNEFDEVYLAYNRFHNPLSQKPVIEKILPIESKSLLTGGKALPSDYIFEPTQVELLNFLVPKFLHFKIFYTLLENSAGEHGARMTAMDKASKNSLDLIDLNTLLRNRARQAAITKELIEIVSGAEALKFQN